MKTSELENYLIELFKPDQFEDYCPNGLQVEGKADIYKILFALSATKESIDFAVEYGADAMIVHHGLFWKFHGTKTITGPFAKRIVPLIKNDINLFSYHLPLDGHPDLGNAATLAKLIGLENLSPFGNYKGAFTGISGQFSTEEDASTLKMNLEKILNHPILYSNPPDRSQKIRSVGIITGGANSEWREAYKSKLDAYITGEMSEHDYHESRESGIHMFAGGHHATEKHGVISLMNHLKDKFQNLECSYFDSDNPA